MLKNSETLLIVYNVECFNPSPQRFGDQKAPVNPVVQWITSYPSFNVALC